jgi:hypothetical protein
MIDALFDLLPHTLGGCIGVILIGLVAAVAALTLLDGRPGGPTGPEMVRRARQLVDDERAPADRWDRASAQLADQARRERECDG